MRVEHFMTKDPIACEADTPVEDVARLMRDKAIGSVVVLRNGRVAGIVTDRQLAVNVLAESLGVDTPVERVMTKDPATVKVDDNIFAVVDTLRSAGVVRRVPVVNEDDVLVGIVSISDIAVIARDLVEAVMLDETHSAMNEARVLTGAKRIVDDIRRPTKADRLPPGQETREVRQGAPAGTVAGSRSGTAGRR